MTQEKYPYGKTFAQVIGYSTKGFTGLEQRCNSDLSTEGTTEIEKIANDFFEYNSKWL